MGGRNTKENLIFLSAREHFICHYLLTKMYDEDTNEWYRMINAFFQMRYSSENQERYVNSRLYANLKEKFSKTQSFNQTGERNSQHGTSWYVLEDAEDVSSRKKFKRGEQPDGYITSVEWRENRKKKISSGFGKNWFTNGSDNIFIKSSEKVPEGFTNGRTVKTIVTELGTKFA